MLERLDLNSRLSELAQIHSWIEELGLRYGIPDQTQYAMDLCLEETLANIIQHGYSGEPNHSISIQFAKPQEDHFALIVDDHAAAFNFLEAPQLPAINPLDDIRIGGQGIRLVRLFADSLHYQPTPNGNRLTLYFSAAGDAAAR